MLSQEEQEILIIKITEKLGVRKKIAKEAISSTKTEEEAFLFAEKLKSQGVIVDGLLEGFSLPRKRGRLARHIASKTEYKQTSSQWMMRRSLTGEKYTEKKAKGYVLPVPPELSHLESLILELVEELRPCYQCAQCSAGCPVFLVDPSMNPRAFIEELLLNPDESIFGSDRIWQCSYCLNCSHVCPHGVDLAHIFMKIRDLAIKHGYKAPEGITKEAEIVYGSGITSEPSKAILKRREKLSLPEVPTTNVDEVQRLLDKTGFKKRIDDQKEVSQTPQEVVSE